MLSRVERTPSPVILPSILSLEVLRGQTGIAVTLPDAIREESFQRDFFHTYDEASSSPATFTTAFEHDECRRGVET